MWDISNLNLGFKLPCGKRYFEREPTRSVPSCVEITRKTFRKLSDLYQELNLEFEKNQKFQIEIRDDENTAVIDSDNITAIETVESGQNILEIKLKLGNNEQIVTITDPRKVSIVYIEAKPAGPRLDANAGEVQYDSGTVGYRLQQIFGTKNDLKNLNVKELTPQEALDLQRNLNSYSLLIIVRKDSIPTGGLKTLEAVLNIKIVDQYQGTNLPNVLVLPMSAVQRITAEEKPNFVSVTWKGGESSRLKNMIFYLPDHRFFVVKPPEAESTNVAKPGSPRVPLAEPPRPEKRPTLRDVLLKINSLTDLKNEEEIHIIPLNNNPKHNLRESLRSDYEYCLVVIENSLLEGVQKLSSVLNLKPDYSSKGIFQQCNVVALRSVQGIRIEYTKNENKIFGINISWYDGRSMCSMIYPIKDYSFFLIGTPKPSDEELLARFLNNPPQPGPPTDKPFDVEQLASAIKAAFGND